MHSCIMCGNADEDAVSYIQRNISLRIVLDVERRCFAIVSWFSSCTSAEYMERVRFLLLISICVVFPPTRCASRFNALGC